MNRILHALALHIGRGAGYCLSGRIENAAYISRPSPHAHTQLSQSLKFLPLELLLLVEAEGFKKTLVQIYIYQARLVPQHSVAWSISFLYFSIANKTGPDSL